MIDEGDIIAAVQEAPEEEDGEEEREEESITISNIAALDSIQNIFNYLQQNSDVKVNVSVISGKTYSVNWKKAKCFSKAAHVGWFL